MCLGLLGEEEDGTGRKCSTPEDRQLSAETHRRHEVPGALKELRRGTVGWRRDEATSLRARQGSQGGASHWPAKGQQGTRVEERGTGLAHGEPPTVVLQPVHEAHREAPAMRPPTAKC